MNTSPRAEQLIRASLIIGLLSIAAACSNDDESTLQSTAQFTESKISFSESDGEHVIDLSFDKPASEDGQIILNASAAILSCIVTEPALENGQIKLPVQKGRNLLHVKISPVDNHSLDGCKIIKLSIASVSAGFRKGGVGDLTISVNDDERPADASFEESGMNVRENNPAGGRINIAFGSPAPADAILIFALESQSKYGVDYVTEPSAVGNRVFIQVAKGATSASVLVRPVNNDTFTADRSINFVLSDASGGLEVGERDSFWCTITEDDGQQISTIAEVRATLLGDAVVLGGKYIEGIVTSISNVSGGRVVIEDATGALPVQFLADQNLTRGDVVLVNLDHGLLHLQQGVLEVRDVNTYQKLGEDILQVNKLSLSELLQANTRVQSQTIQVGGVSFSQADGSSTLFGDRAISDGVNTIIVRTIDNASFGDQLVPGGLLNVTGIFVSIDGQNYLYPQDITDIKKPGGAGIKHGSIEVR